MSTSGFWKHSCTQVYTCMCVHAHTHTRTQACTSSSAHIHACARTHTPYPQTTNNINILIEERQEGQHAFPYYSHAVAMQGGPVSTMKRLLIHWSEALHEAKQRNLLKLLLSPLVSTEIGDNAIGGWGKEQNSSSFSQEANPREAYALWNFPRHVESILVLYPCILLSGVLFFPTLSWYYAATCPGILEISQGPNCGLSCHL